MIWEEVPIDDDISRDEGKTNNLNESNYNSKTKHEISDEEYDPKNDDIIVDGLFYKRNASTIK